MRKLNRLLFAGAFLIILLLIIVKAALGAEAKVPIRERITLRILEEVGSDTDIDRKLKEGTETDTSIREKKQKIIEEEIQNDIVKIEVLAIKIYDVSYQARKLRKEINYAIANTNFKKYLREKNYAMARNCLEKVGVDNGVIDILIAELGQSAPKLRITGFGEYVMAHSQTYEGKADENAFVVGSYQEEVQQNDLAIFDITKWSNVIKAVEFVQKNKDKLDAVIVGWGNAGENNFDELDFSKYPAIMKNHEYFVSTIKAVKPDLPVGFCVTYRENTMYQWLNACNFSYDFLAVFNITKMGANFEKIQKRFPKQKIMIAGQNAGESQEYGGTAYENYIEKLKKLGYIGSIWIK